MDTNKIFTEAAHATCCCSKFEKPRIVLGRPRSVAVLRHGAPTIERGFRRQPCEGLPVPLATALRLLLRRHLLSEEPVEPTTVTSGATKLGGTKRWTGTGLKETGKRRRAK